MTMIDRIAQTLRAQLSPMGGNVVSGGAMSDEEVREIAFAILQELQNPSDAMAEAGAKAAYDNVIDADAHSLRIIFAAMIDAALFDDA